MLSPCFAFFFFNDTATTEIYTLSLHDALPISSGCQLNTGDGMGPVPREGPDVLGLHMAQHVAVATDDNNAEKCLARDRKSTRLNSSHGYISYAVFCLKKKKTPHAPIVTGSYEG